MSSASPTVALLKTKAKKSTSVVENPTILTSAHEIENIDQTTAFSLVPTLMEETEYGLFRLGGVLSVIQNHGWFGEHPNFKTLIEKEFGLQYRKAMYLVEIYNKLIDNDIPFELVKDVGWTKLRILARHLTPENVEYWVAQALKMTAIQLMDALASAASSGVEKATDGEPSTVSSTVTTMTFKVHEDQKDVIRAALQKVKEETNTDVDTVALEHLCVGYLGGSVDISTSNTSLTESMKAAGWEQVLDVFGNLWPDVNLVVKA